MLGREIWGLMAGTGRRVLPVLRGVTGYSRVESLRSVDVLLPPAQLGVRKIGLQRWQPLDNECPELPLLPGFCEQQTGSVPESQMA